MLLKTSFTRLCFRTEQTLRCEENKLKDEVLWMQLSSVELFAFHQYPFELLLSIYKFKTSVLSNSRLLNKLKLFLKKLLFQKRRWLGDLPPRKDGILHPPSGCLGTPLPLHKSLCGSTVTSQPRFLGSIGYQICLAMVFRWRTSRAGWAMTR